MNIILLGPQGSGKGTQGEMISKKYNLYYFESGEFLRNIAKNDPEIDHIINDVGALLPDEKMFSLVKNHFLERNQFNNILFDGYPRSLPQYNLLTSFLMEHAEGVTIAFALEIPEEETIRRLSSRRMDPETHEIYNLITNPPPPNVPIDTLVHREDDTEPLIKRRLAAYRANTEPLVQKLKEEGLLIEVDGTKDIETIFSEIAAKIDSIL